MNQHALGLANLLTFLLEHHAEDIFAVTYGNVSSVVMLKSPPKGATMLGWDWEPSELRGKMEHRTASGIIVFAPTHEVSA